MIKNSRESLLVFFISALILDALAHWEPSLRQTWNFLPTARGGDTNEFVTLWIDLFSKAVRAKPFAETFYFANPRVALGDYYTSHPGFLTFLSAICQSLFGESPMVLRRLAIFLFSVRLALFFGLTKRWLGRGAALLTLAIYLAIPATQSYTQALSFEVISSTFALAAFAALPNSAFAMGLAVCTDFTALLFCLATRKRMLWVIGLAAFTLAFFWSRHFDSSSGQIARLRDFLLGPFYVLPTNEGARIMLWQSIKASFPLFLVIAAGFDFYKHGWRGRPDWFYAMLVPGALLLLCFLGVFRAHAYLSSAIALALSAAAARAWMELFQNKKMICAGLALLGLGEAAYRFEFPLQTSASAKARVEFQEEAQKLAPMLGGKKFNVIQDETLLRPKPLENLLGNFTWSACGELTIALDGLGSPLCEAVTQKEKHLQLLRCRCPQ